jgi:hypothetical protein
LIPSRILSLETLEARDVPATWGNPWPDAGHLTISFAPDGTDIGGQQSALFARLDSIEPQAVWQKDILRAFQAWVPAANINFGVVTDGGQAFGAAGQPQGDPRFGDIRIGAGSFGGSVFGFTGPFDITSGAWSGDIRLNLDTLPTVFAPGGEGLYTLLVHEVGHSLGLADNLDPTSVMYEYANGAHTGPSAGDIAAVQAIYGARPMDSTTGYTGSPTSATQLGAFQSIAGVLSLTASGDLNNPTGADAYSFTTPSLVGGFTLTLQRAGLSLVTPTVSLYDSRGNLVSSATSSDPLGGDLTINVGRLSPLAKYTAVVKGAGGAFDEGAYHLSIQAVPVVNSLLGSLTSTVTSTVQTVTSNLPTNNTLLTAGLLNLQSLTPAASDFHVAYLGNFNGLSQQQYYRIDVPANSPPVLQVMAWGTGNGQFAPKISLLNASGQAVPTTVLTNEGGVMAFQLQQVAAGTYFVEVQAARPGATGGFFLGADLRQAPTQMATLASGTASSAQSGTLTIYNTALMHFVVQANSGDGVRLDVLDSRGNVVSTAVAEPGQAASLTVDLQPGQYTLRVTPFRDDGLPATTDFTLSAILLSEPMGPQASDPTATPSKTTTTTSSSPPPSGMTPQQQQQYYTYQQQQKTSSGPQAPTTTSSGYST